MQSLAALSKQFGVYVQLKQENRLRQALESKNPNNMKAGRAALCNTEHSAAFLLVV